MTLQPVPNKKYGENASPFQRAFRMALFTIFCLIFIFLAINLIFAWIFITSLIEPGCPQHQPITRFPKPGEYWLETEDGIQIRIWYYPPQNGHVIMTFGGLTGSLGDQIPAVEPLLLHGYGILQVDTRACARPAAQVTLGANEVFDAEAALIFLQSRPEVDKNGIGVIGFSMGGATAIQIMARHPEIKALIRDGGYESLEGLFTPPKDVNIFVKFFQAISSWLFQLSTGVDPQDIRPIDALIEINPRPVLLIYGEMEAEPGLSQYKAGGDSVHLWIVSGGSHGRNHIVAPEEYQKRVFEFFDQALMPKQLR